MYLFLNSFRNLKKCFKNLHIYATRCWKWSFCPHIKMLQPLHSTGLIRKTRWRAYRCPNLFAHTVEKGSSASHLKSCKTGFACITLKLVVSPLELREFGKRERYRKEEILILSRALSKVRAELLSCFRDSVKESCCCAEIDLRAYIFFRQWLCRHFPWEGCGSDKRENPCNGRLGSCLIWLLREAAKLN